MIWPAIRDGGEEGAGDALDFLAGFGPLGGFRTRDQDFDLYHLQIADHRQAGALADTKQPDLVSQVGAAAQRTAIHRDDDIRGHKSGLVGR